MATETVHSHRRNSGLGQFPEAHRSHELDVKPLGHRAVGQRNGVAVLVTLQAVALSVLYRRFDHGPPFYSIPVSGVRTVVTVAPPEPKVNSISKAWIGFGGIGRRTTARPGMSEP